MQLCGHMGRFRLHLHSSTTHLGAPNLLHFTILPLVTRCTRKHLHQLMHQNYTTITTYLKLKAEWTTSSPQTLSVIHEISPNFTSFIIRDSFPKYHKKPTWVTLSRDCEVLGFNERFAKVSLGPLVSASK